MWKESEEIPPEALMKSLKGVRLNPWRVENNISQKSQRETFERSLSKSPKECWWHLGWKSDEILWKYHVKTSEGILMKKFLKGSWQNSSRAADKKKTFREWVAISEETLTKSEKRFFRNSGRDLDEGYKEIPEGIKTKSFDRLERTLLMGIRWSFLPAF